jgi:hypothetical protein
MRIGWCMYQYPSLAPQREYDEWNGDQWVNNRLNVTYGTTSGQMLRHIFWLFYAI